MDRMREKSEVELTGFSARLCVLPNLSETSLRSSIRRLLKCAGFESSSRSNALQGVSWHPARQPETGGLYRILVGERSPDPRAFDVLRVDRYGRGTRGVYQH